MNTRRTTSLDRLIWMSLIAVLAAALIADQARANLHAAARADAAYTTAIEDQGRLTAADWCRLHLEALTGERMIRLDEATGRAAIAARDRLAAVRSGRLFHTDGTDALR